MAAGPSEIEPFAVLAACIAVRKRIRYVKDGTRPALVEEGSDWMAYWRRSSRQMQAATGEVAVAPTSPVTEKPKSRSRMMRQYDLVERVRSYNPDTDEDQALLRMAGLKAAPPEQTIQIG